MEFARLQLAAGKAAAADSLSRAVDSARTARGNWIYSLESKHLLGTILVRLGRNSEAEAVLRDAYDISRRNPHTAYRATFARMLADLYSASDRTELARQYQSAANTGRR